MYFWGIQGDQTSTEPIVIGSDLGRVLDMATTRGCKFSALQTHSDIYSWGEWHGKRATKPRLTTFSTFEQVFAAADPPFLCGTLEFRGRGRRISDAMKTAFHDVVRNFVKPLLQKFNFIDYTNDLIALL